MADTMNAALDAQTIKHISALSELVRMPNAEYFADAHNAAVRHLRALAAQAKLAGGEQLHAASVQAEAGLGPVEQRQLDIGKAIERACQALPEETEIIVSLEKGAGTVTLIDQDGYENENFSTVYGFAGALNDAIDTAIAAQGK